MSESCWVIDSGEGRNNSGSAWDCDISNVFYKDWFWWAVRMTCELSKEKYEMNGFKGNMKWMD